MRGVAIQTNRVEHIRLLFSYVVLALVLTSCGPTQLSLRTQIPSLSVRSLPLNAAIVVPSEVATATFRKSICGENLIVSIGREFETGARQAFYQVFDSIEVVQARTTAVGHYDVIVELDSPQLVVEGMCFGRGLMMWMGLYATLASQKVAASAAVAARVSDRNGEILMSDSRYKSETYSRNFGGLDAGLPYLEKVMTDALADAVQQMARTIALSGRLRNYAQGLSGKPEDRRVTAQQEPTPISDVDAPPKVGAVQKKSKHAVVIGVQDYREDLPKASFASHDAYVVRKYLTSVLGYSEENVVLLQNERATKSDLEKYFEGWLPNRVEPGDSVFVYFSGHGTPNARTKEAYLVPYDGDPAFVEKTGYSLNRLYQQLAMLPASEVVLVLDACFSGAGGRSVIPKGMRPVGLSVEAPAIASGRTVVLTASSGEQVSSTYNQKSHGLLTYFFLKGLQGEAVQNKDGRLDLAELYAYLKPQVERVSRREFNNEQTPQLLGSPEILKRGVHLIEKNSP